jgi:hypothetical protein
MLSFLLDTGPLSVLCGFPINGTPYIHTILQYAMIVLSDEVINEFGRAGKKARVVLPLLKTGQVRSIASPAEPEILDRA